jgi:hypothetical protein
MIKRSGKKEKGNTYIYQHLGDNAFTIDDTKTVELLSNTKQSRLTFFTDLVEQVVGSLDDKVFENDILPVIYPILKWKKVENKNLYESAHTAVISAFIAEKPVSRELAGVYGKILIDVSRPNKCFYRTMAKNKKCRISQSQ